MESNNYKSKFKLKNYRSTERIIIRKKKRAEGSLDEKYQIKCKIYEDHLISFQAIFSYGNFYL